MFALVFLVADVECVAVAKVGFEIIDLVSVEVVVVEVKGVFDVNAVVDLIVGPTND